MVADQIRAVDEPELFTTSRRSVGLELPILKLVPSNTSPEPLVTTLEPFKYATPLAVPPDRVTVPANVPFPVLLTLNNVEGVTAELAVPGLDVA